MRLLAALVKEMLPRTGPKVAKGRGFAGESVQVERRYGFPTRKAVR